MIFLIIGDNNYCGIVLIFMKPQKYLSLKLYDMIVRKILIAYHLKFIHKTWQFLTNKYSVIDLFSLFIHRDSLIWNVSTWCRISLHYKALIRKYIVFVHVPLYQLQWSVCCNSVLLCIWPSMLFSTLEWGLLSFAPTINNHCSNKFNLILVVKTFCLTNITL